MNKRILLCIDKNQFKKFNYKQKWNKAMCSMGYNSGNNVFQFALQKMLLSPDVTVDVDDTFLNKTEDFISRVDYINNNYDACITSPANVLAIWAKDTALKRWAEAVSLVKIPFNFVGVGAQSNLEYSLDFVDDIRYEAREFITAILNTGGGLGVRGYFTAEVLKKLGYSEYDFSVIGCPSLFLNGSDLKIKTPKLSEQELRPVINGFNCWFCNNFHKYFYKYPQALYVCQDEFYRLLYKTDHCIIKDLNYLRTDLFEILYKENRVALYCEFLAWYNDLKNRQCNFSMGSRIHGNIVPILAGIPAFVDVIDSRTKELAEYFNIPNRALKNKIPDPYELYCSLDYKKFNQNFSGLFDKFATFFKRNNLPFFDDIKYTNQEIQNVPYAIVSTKGIDGVKEIIKVKKRLEKAKNRKPKSKLYKFCHLYWLRGKK